MTRPVIPPPARDLSRVAAIVGIGETDYRDDYRAARAKAPDYTPPTPMSLSTTAFERALADAGLERGDIDGLAVAFLYGGPDVDEVARDLGITPRKAWETMGIMAGPLPEACAAIASGECDTVALVYAVATRSIGRTFGGQKGVAPEGTPPSYYYHNPWGFSSQAAHWAMVATRYLAEHGLNEDDLGVVAQQLRMHAQRHPQAIMQQPLRLEEYRASRYVVEPLHLFDLCLVNDGGVCLILRRRDLAAKGAHTPVLVSGWGEARVETDKLDALVRGRLRPQFQDAGAQSLGMAGLALEDVRHLECYDASTMHLLNHLEGHGFVAPGEGPAFCRAGGMDVSGRLPVNTAGGMLSGSYMHGWNHVAEIVRQLRHEAGERQIADVDVSMFSLAETDRVHPLVFERER